jgi:DNA-binding transcriptional MerR regulator
MTYQPSQAAKVIGSSVASVRSYSIRFKDFLSPTATPPPGQARLFSPEDLRVLRFVKAATDGGATLDEVETRLRAGELAGFAWSPDEVAQAEAHEAAQAQTALALPQVFGRLFAQMEEARRAEVEAARQREADLVARLLEAERKIGQLEGQLEGMKKTGEGPRPSFWKRLFD